LPASRSPRARRNIRRLPGNRQIKSAPWRLRGGLRAPPPRRARIGITQVGVGSHHDRDSNPTRKINLENPRATRRGPPADAPAAPRRAQCEGRPPGSRSREIGPRGTGNSRLRSLAEYSGPPQKAHKIAGSDPNHSGFGAMPAPEARPPGAAARTSRPWRPEARCPRRARGASDSRPRSDRDTLI
jgi:hypothetical protein